METQDNQHLRVFPPEYAHLNKRVTKAEARLRRLDREMSRQLPHPALNYTPSGTPPKVNQLPQRTKAKIQKEKDELKARVYKEVENTTANASAQARKEMQDNAFGRLYREDIEQLEAQGALADPAATWTLDKAQINSLNMAKQFRDDQRRKEKDQRPEAPTIDEMTDRFLQKLELHQLQHRTTERSTERESPDPEPEP